MEGMGLEPGEHRFAGVGGLGVQAIVENDRLDSVGRPLQGQVRRLFRSSLGLSVKDFLNGTWFGHPLHPALTDIPLGAWTAAAVFDVVTVTRLANLERAANAALVTGIVGAVASAATGLADWADTNSEQRRVGLVHAGLNTVALGLQIASVVGRRRQLRGARMLSALGYAVAGAGAYLGGELVFRQGTQVNRRAYARGPRTFTAIMPVADLFPGQPTRAMADGEAVMVVEHQGEVFAMDDVCGHAGCPLSQGRLRGDAIVCPCHGSTYRLRDGAVIHGPSPYPQPTFEVRLDGGDVSVRRR